MPPVRKKQTYFKNEWLHSEELDFNIWLKIGTDNTSFRCKICKTNKDLALGQSGIGSLKKHAEGDTHKKNMVLHKKTLNFFQPSSSKSIVIEDDDVSCSSHSNTQQDLNKPATRPNQSIFDQGTTSITLLFKDLLYSPRISAFFAAANKMPR